MYAFQMPLYKTFASVIGLVLLLHIQVVDLADSDKPEEFHCNICSYTDAEGGNGVACLNNTNYLKTVNGHSLKCGNYCVTSEVWDKRARKVKSIFRSCSTFWGNDCSDDWTIVNCKTSCKGDYCNNFTIDESRIDTLCQRFNCEHNGYVTFNMDIATTFYTIGFVVVLVAYLT